MTATWLRWDGPDLVLSLHIQPGARKDEIAGPHGERLKIRITAPPVDGKANKHLLKYLARCFGVATSQVELLSGQSGREKRVRIHQPASLPDIISPPPPH